MEVDVALARTDTLVMKETWNSVWLAAKPDGLQS